GLLTAAVMKFMVTGPRTATRTNLSAMQEKLDTQWKAVTDTARKESMASVQTPILALSGAASLQEQAARDKYIEYKLVQAFPMTFSEALTPYPSQPGLLPWPAYVTYLGKIGITAANAASNTTPLEVQRAVLLLMSLTVGPKNTGVTKDNWGTSAIDR